MASKVKKHKIIMRSTAKGSRYFYTTTLSKAVKSKGKFSQMGYDPFVRKHVEFIEEKMR